MVKYSGLRLLREGLRGHTGWPRIWQNPKLKKSYEVVIIGGGGHGLATAYYLAKNHGITDIAVLEKNWIGGGNTGRNTSIIRSNYLYPESAAFYDFSLRLYESLSRDLNYNVMYNPKGMVTLAHSEHDLEQMARWVTAIQCNGIDSELLTANQVYDHIPLLNSNDKPRLPIFGGYIQKRGGTARHDAVTWGYARAASALGVDIIQGCDVKGFSIRNGAICGVKTSLGSISTSKVGLAVAGHSTILAHKAGVDLPINSLCLQALVSEPIKPIMNTIALSPATGVYFSQSEQGGLVIGGTLDAYCSYAQRGGFHVTEHTLSGLVDMFPALGNLKMLRQWAGIVDIVHDSSPILGKSPVGGLYLNCGWGTGGFKAIPGGGFCFAHTIATDQPHSLTAAFDLNRFTTGKMIDETAASGIPH